MSVHRLWTCKEIIVAERPDNNYPYKSTLVKKTFPKKETLLDRKYSKKILVSQLIEKFRAQNLEKNLYKNDESPKAFISDN